jgi:hypothetical protein
VGHEGVWGRRGKAPHVLALFKSSFTYQHFIRRFMAGVAIKRLAQVKAQAKLSRYSHAGAKGKRLAENTFNNVRVLRTKYFI